MTNILKNEIKVGKTQKLGKKVRKMWSGMWSTNIYFLWRFIYGTYYFDIVNISFIYDNIKTKHYVSYNSVITEHKCYIYYVVIFFLLILLLSSETQHSHFLPLNIFILIILTKFVSIKGQFRNTPKINLKKVRITQKLSWKSFLRLFN